MNGVTGGGQGICDDRKQPSVKNRDYYQEGGQHYLKLRHLRKTPYNELLCCL